MATRKYTFEHDITATTTDEMVALLKRAYREGLEVTLHRGSAVGKPPLRGRASPTNEEDWGTWTCNHRDFVPLEQPGRSVTLKHAERLDPQTGLVVRR